MGYSGATICLNGHVVSYRNANSQKYCSKCGQETYSTCTHCGQPIRGKYEAQGIVDLTGYYDKPYYCYNCGEPYPWTQIILDNAVELLALDDDINDESKQLIKDSLPDLMIETPKTPIAVAKYKKGMSKAGQVVADSMRQLLVDVISETAKKVLFP